MKRKQWKTVAATAAVLAICTSFIGCPPAANGPETDPDHPPITDGQLKLITKYVRPLKFNVKNISGLAVTKKASGSLTPAASARDASANDNAENDVNLLVIKENGEAEEAVALVTEGNYSEAEKEEKEGYVLRYVTPENNTIATVLETKQCTYELNDKEAAGYYIVFDGSSTYTYNDGTSETTGSLIYVTPDGIEKDIFKEAKEDLSTIVDFYNTAWNGDSYMQFDENGNAFFVAIQGNSKKIYRYQPIAGKLDDLTPEGISGLSIDRFAVSLDGKYIVFAWSATVNNEAKKGVKAVKIADKSVKDIYTCVIPGDYCDVPNIVYMDKNHSFYFITDSWDPKEENGKGYDNVDNYVHRWNYLTKELTSSKYTAGSKYYSEEVNDPAEGSGPLISTEEGIFVMQPFNWIDETDEAEGHWTKSKLAKLTDENGDFIKAEIPASLKQKEFAAPRYNLVVADPDYKDPSTWYTPSFLTNGKGIAVIGKIPESDTQDTIWYYEDGQLKNLLAFDTDRQSINKMTLSDKAIIFNAQNSKTKTEYTKSVNLEDNSVTTISINKTVVNMLAVKGKTFSEDEATEAKINISVTISEQSDLEIEQKIENNILTLKAPTGGDKYSWTVNGVLLGETNTLTKDVSAWEAGPYPIYAVMKKGNFVYSSFIVVDIIR